MKVMPKKNKHKKKDRQLFRVRPNTVQPTMESDLMTPDLTSPSNPAYPGGLSANPEATIAWCNKNCKFASV